MTNTRSFTRKIALTMTFAFAASSLIATAADASVENRLKQLEETVDSLKKENKDLKTQLGWDGKKPVNLVSNSHFDGTRRERSGRIKVWAQERTRA